MLRDITLIDRPILGEKKSRYHSALEILTSTIS